MRQPIMQKIMFVLGMLIWVTGCSGQAELPTPVPTAVVPVTPSEEPVTPTANLPPTRDLATATPEPTAVLPTRQATTTPTPVIGPVINIDQPVAAEPVVMGSSLTVSGFAQIPGGMTIQVGLVSAGGQVLATADADVDISQWSATLTVPEQITGVGEAQAVIVDAGGEAVARDSAPVTITADRQANDSYVTLIRPDANSVGVAGHNFFLDGQLWRQGGGNLQVGIFMDGCQELVSDIFFQLGTSSYWQGYVILPQDVSGPACATAWVGTPGDDAYRAAMVPVTILSKDDPQATGVMISNPREGRNLTAGETMEVTGVAYNIPGRTVNIEILLENGQVIGEAEDDADFYGYFSAEVPLPPGLESEAVVRVTTGEDRAQPDSESTVVFNIVP